MFEAIGISRKVSRYFELEHVFSEFGKAMIELPENNKFNISTIPDEDPTT